MNPEYDDLLKSKMNESSYAKLTALENKKLYDFVGKFIKHCDPDTLYMCDDSKEDEEYVKKMAIEKGEEQKMAKTGQTIHWDGYNDQARDKKNTKFMVPKDKHDDMKHLNMVDYDEGVAEIMEIAQGIMKGKDAVIKLFCEGPTFSQFTRPCVQITDSWYVCHSEQILYRSAYEHFKAMDNKDDFYRFIHSAGQLDDRGCTVNLEKRRIYMDTYNLIVYSMNAQYAGNSVGLKKHSMRLAIKQSGEQGWLCEHMFIMACVNEKANRNTYFAGAFPSACGKTSTAMLPGEKIVGDDIAYFKNINGEFKAVNVEQGIFGIIKDVNSKDDPVIYKTLHDEKEMIFSNILKGPDGNPYWMGMGVETPEEGDNHSGAWTKGKTDANGKEVGITHGNARYTMKLEYLDNIDKAYEDKDGVVIGGVIYGGRDSDTMVPVEESFDWADGIIMKACTLESETTSATLGQEGVRVPCMMANNDFISYSYGKYIQNNLDFVKGITNVPKVFSTNYFLRDENKQFCTGKLAKKVWLHWAEGRAHGEYEALKTPTGFIPKYEDLKNLFKELLDEDYAEADYTYQFSFRCDAWKAKIERAIAYFNEKAPDCPKEASEKWASAIKVIEAAKEKYGAVIKPGNYEG